MAGSYRFRNDRLEFIVISFPPSGAVAATWSIQTAGRIPATLYKQLCLRPFESSNQIPRFPIVLPHKMKRFVYIIRSDRSASEKLPGRIVSLQNLKQPCIVIFDAADISPAVSSSQRQAEIPVFRRKSTNFHFNKAGGIGQRMTDFGLLSSVKPRSGDIRAWFP